MPKITKVLFFSLILHFSFIPYEENKRFDFKPVVSTETVSNSSEKSKRFFEETSLATYTSITSFSGKPSYTAFRYAYAGYLEMVESGKILNPTYLTIIDMSLSSKKERLWVINMETGTVIWNTLVAHGRNSGKEFAQNFSNKPQSFMSSLGFYVTGAPYIGSHGLSLMLNGVEKGVNDNALARAVVMHGADYVSYNSIRQLGFLGRSFGCPSIPSEVKDKLIPDIANGTCMFIYYPDPTYIAGSSFLKFLFS
jgi:hypothetical protein